MLDSPLFEAPTTWEKAPATVRAGGTIDLPFLLPPLVCGDDGTATVELGISGTAVELNPADPLGAMAGFRDAACASARIDDSVALLGSAVTVTGVAEAAVAYLEVTVTPSGGVEPVTVDSIRSTVLLVPQSGQEWPLDLVVEEGSSSTTVSLAIVPRRCDAHALAEDKVGTLFPVRYEVGGEEYSLPLPLADGVKNDLLNFVGLHCGFLAP